jgi:FkbM family methyltransferase
LFESLRAFTRKVAKRKTLDTLTDVIKYYPKGLKKRVSTPDGVKLALNGLHPVTIGRYRAGSTEKEEQALIESIPENIPIVEIGAGVGYITTLMSRQTNKTHVAIEPNPTVYPLLEKTKELNNSNFEAIHAAYHPNDSTVSFPTTKFFKTVTNDGSVEGSATVKAMSLEDIVTEFGLADFHLHIDIEGSEELLLRREMDVLKKYCSSVSLEFHRQRLTDADELFEKLCESFEEVGRHGSSERPVILLENTTKNIC